MKAIPTDFIEIDTDPDEIGWDRFEMGLYPKRIATDFFVRGCDSLVIASAHKEIGCDPNEIRSDPKGIGSDPKASECDPDEIHIDHEQIGTDHEGPESKRLEKDSVRGVGSAFSQERENRTERFLRALFVNASQRFG